MLDIPLTVLRGFLMGAADLVPGVSGGTVALVLGIYTRLIDSIRSGSVAMARLVRLDTKGSAEMLRKVDWRFLVPLLGGILLAVAALAGPIEHLLEHQPVPMAGLFAGLVLGSAVVASFMVRQWEPSGYAAAVGVAVVTFILLGLRGGTSEDVVAQASDPALWAFLGAGALAICAMILPGISGSFILVTLGMYAPVLAAVSDRDLLPLVVFAIGCVLGLGSFSHVLHVALTRHHDLVMGALIGLMLGSLRVLWPWPNGVESSDLGAPSGPILVPVALAIGSAVLVIGFDQVSRRRAAEIPEPV